MMQSLRTIVLLSAALSGSLWAQAVGTIAGSLFDATNGQPVRQATLQVDGRSERATSDTSGAFKIQLPPGTYRLKITAPNYADTAIDAVEVKADETVEASTVMALKSAVTTVDVVEKVGAVAATAEAMLAERRLSAVVSDAISSEELRAGTASNAAGALERVTGVSIVDNGFVYVRGLGERYSTTQLNNALIPTTEPERRVVPLDLFPAALIDNIRILKTYTPDLPGEFAGGLVDMKTVEFPAGPVFNVSGNVGFNTRTSFNDFLTYPGGGQDIFGFDDGTRGIPAAIPRDQRLFQGQYTAQQLVDFGRAFTPNWQPTTNRSMRPNQSFTVVGGNTFGRIGVVGALTFNNKPQRYDERRRFYRVSGTEPILFTQYDDFRDNIETARMGGVFNVAIRLTAANKVVFRNTLTHDADKETRILSGDEGGSGQFLSSERLRFIERTLSSHSVEGEHALARLANSVFRWQFTFSRSTRNEPDLREVIRGRQENGQFAFVQQIQSGQRFYNDLTDRIYEPQAEFSTPFFRGGFSGLVKVGFRATLRSRDFQARRFRFLPFRQDQIDFTLPSNRLFALENIRTTGFVPVETTRGTDRYDANLDIFAGYAMADVNLTSRWRVVGGVRIEDADLVVNTIDPLVPGARPSVARLANRDPLPGVNLIYAATPRQNLRFSYSRTLSRPDFRELSPFEFTNVVGGFNTVGNPNLRRATINNFDARWEWFPGASQLIAASYFVKRFKDPVETTLQAVADLRQSFINADGALNHGLELEFRKGLGFLNRRFSQFNLQTNFTLVDSNVDLPEGEVVLTSRSRPLVGQSRYLANVVAEWNRPQLRSNAKFYVSSVSRRISDVGAFGLPDVYQERNTLMDFVYQYSLAESGKYSVRFAAQNLGDNLYRYTQAGLLFREFQVGRTFEVGLSISLF